MATGTRWSVPAGFTAVPLSPQITPGCIPVCVVVRDEPDELGGVFVQLADEVDAKAVLGCVRDLGGRVQRWLRILIQDVDKARRSIQAALEATNNAAMDERWRRSCRAQLVSNASPTVATGWELDPSPPLAIDRAKGCTVVLTEASGAELALCRDEGALSAAGLPGYQATTARYLWARVWASRARSCP